MSQHSPWQFLKSKRTFYVIAAVGFLFKYWLVLGDEIEPFYRPLDDLNFVLLGKSWYWWAEYSHWSFHRPPVWPLVLGLINYSEIPLRIIQELFLCWASYFMIHRFSKNGLNPFVAGICFTVIILHPGFLQLASRTLRECFYVSLLFVLIAQLIPLANRRLLDVRWYQLLPVGITSALLWQTREESAIIASMLVGFVFIFWILKQELPRPKLFGRQIGWIFIGLAGPIIICSLAVRTANYARHGLFIPHEYAGISWQVTLKRLMQIKPGKPEPWVSVERESLEKAYAVSPTLASIREPFDKRFGPAWAAATVGMTKNEKEIAGSAFYFALIESAAEAGYYADAVTAYNFYRSVNAELEAAFESGKLEKRLVLSSYLDPEFSDFLPRFPKGLLHIIGFGFRPLKDNDIRIYYPRHDVFRTLEAYDDVTNRRHELAYRKVQRIRGWAFLEGKQISRVDMLDHDNLVLDSTSNIYDRPDVKAAYETNQAPLKSGFEISLPKADYPNWPAKVVFHTTTGETATIQASRLLKHGQEQDKDSSGTLLRVNVDEIKTGKDDFATQDAIQAWLWLNHGKFHLVLGSVAFLVLFARYIACKPHARARHYYRWILFILLVIGLRVLITTLMDISSFRLDLRYVFPAVVFLPVLFGLILQEGLTGFKEKQLRW